MGNRDGSRVELLMEASSSAMMVFTNQVTVLAPMPAPAAPVPAPMKTESPPRSSRAAANAPGREANAGEKTRRSTEDESADALAAFTGGEGGGSGSTAPLLPPSLRHVSQSLATTIVGVGGGGEGEGAPVDPAHLQACRDVDAHLEVTQQQLEKLLEQIKLARPRYQKG